MDLHQCAVSGWIIPFNATLSPGTFVQKEEVERGWRRMIEGCGVGGKVGERGRRRGEQ